MFRNSKLTVIATLTATFAISGSSVASAMAPVHSAPAKPLAAKTVSVAQMQGGATGDGPADDNECEEAAGLIDTFNALAEGDEKYGDGSRAAGYRQRAAEEEDAEMDHGCFFID